MNKEHKQATKILEKLYETVARQRASNQFKPLSSVATSMDPFLDGIEKDKSLVSVIVTSALKKLVSSTQDIRLHMTKFTGGYSARSFDTQVTTPFLNKYFPKYANKETAFLTKATRADVIWNKRDGTKLPLRSKQLVAPFLDLIDKIQHKKIAPKECLAYVIAKLQELSEKEQIFYDDALSAADVVGVINIHTVIEMLKEHFESKLGSRLPVIAIYAIYEQMMRSMKRYKNKRLLPLNIHTSPDKHSYGDVEVVREDDTPFEIVEVKHNIPIDQNLVIDVAKKSNGTRIERYYVLTTYPESFADNGEEASINLMVQKIKKESGVEIISNGILPSVKYYLRFVDDYNQYLKSYTDALVDDSKRSTEITIAHVNKWREILKEFGATPS